MQRFINLQKGMSLIEVIIAIGLMSILVMGTASLVINLGKQNKSLQQKLESIELEQSITRLLADNNSCKCMFENIVWPGGAELALSDLKNGCGGVLLTANTVINSSSTGLKVSSIKLKNLVSLEATKKSADIVIDFDANSKVGPLKAITIASQGFILLGGVIDKCMGMPGAQQICTSMGGIWSSGICSMPSLGALANSTATCVEAYGPGWTWNGSVCLPPTQSCSASVGCPNGIQGQICLTRTFQMCNGWTGLDTKQCINGVWTLLDSVPAEVCAGG